MNKEKIKSFFTEKRIYVLAAVTLMLTAIAIAVIYSESMSMLEGTFTTESTRLVEKNQTGVPDNRVTTTETTTATTEKRETTTTAVRKETTTAVTPTLKPTEGGYMLPLEGDVLRVYSPEVPLYNKTMSDWRVHKGTDITATEKSEALAVANGKVTKAYYDMSYGYTVELDCGDFVARYCGLNEESAVGIDSVLNKGDTVGAIGTIPCEEEDGLHLHFEIVKEGLNVDPQSLY